MKKKIVLCGGPLDGREVLTTSGGNTLTFKMYKQKGRYIDGVWVNHV